MKKAIFFDCDGVLIRDEKYLSDPDKVKPIPQAIEIVKMAKDKGVQLSFQKFDQSRLFVISD